MTEPSCESCGRRAPHAHTLCTRCLRTFATSAAKVADLHLDLATVAGRQTRYGGGGRGSDATPLLVDARFADRDGRGTELVADTRATLIRWCQHLIAPGQPFPRTVSGLCAHLVTHADAVAAAPWGPVCLEEILDLEHRHKRLVDRPADRWYAGVCGATLTPTRPHDGTTCACACHNGPGHPCDIPGGCGLEYGGSEAVMCERVLYVEPGRRTVTCRTCDAEHLVEHRREQLLAEAVERQATVETITRIVTTLMGRDVSASRLAARIRQWAQRKRIASHGVRVVDGRERPTYRVGDVIELLTEDQAKAG